MAHQGLQAFETRRAKLLRSFTRECGRHPALRFHCVWRTRDGAPGHGQEGGAGRAQAARPTPHYPQRRALLGQSKLKQFREVKLQFGLLDLVDTRSSRCARCNSDTFSPIDACSARKEMSERLRKKVPDSVVKFWACDGCGRIYWEGPKYTPAMNPDTAPSPDGRVAYRPVPRKRVAGDRFDQRHLPDPLP
ncbi:hypothetical protein ON010_g9294 [Phytophthora cinnamomi]|nr:hypothetical protein ON010_g9294 [Phytophthora cinnamomi]